MLNYYSLTYRFVSTYFLHNRIFRSLLARGAGRPPWLQDEHSSLLSERVCSSRSTRQPLPDSGLRSLRLPTL